MTAVIRPPHRTSALRFYLDALWTVVAVVVVTVAAVAIVVSVATRLSPARSYGQYRVFGHPVMVVISGSMAPSIRTGDLIVDAPLDQRAAEALQPGDVVTFRDSPTSNMVITHRIIGVTRRNGAVAYVTQGDANGAPDAALRPAHLAVGRVSHVVPRGGYILDSLHRPLVPGLLLASPLLWFAAGPLFAVARRLDQQASQEPAAPAGDQREVAVTDP